MLGPRLVGDDIHGSEEDLMMVDFFVKVNVGNLNL
jgi:hypothetical protein